MWENESASMGKKERHTPTKEEDSLEDGTEPAKKGYITWTWQVTNAV